MSQSLERRIAELERRQGNLLRLGVVSAVAAASARVKVSSAGIVTGWLPWFTRRAGDDRSWWAPSVGEQVMLLCPCGDPAQAVVLPGIYRDSAPAPADTADLMRLTFADGAVIEYDKAAHRLAATIPGDVALTADGNLTATIGGDMTASIGGDLTATATAATIQAATVTVQGSASISLSAPTISLAGVFSMTGPGGGAGTEEKTVATNQTGNFTLNGNLQVNGNIDCTGTNPNHHSHP